MYPFSSIGTILHSEKQRDVVTIDPFSIPGLRIVNAKKKNS
jgi:hypothetical protein